MKKLLKLITADLLLSLNDDNYQYSRRKIKLKLNKNHRRSLIAEIHNKDRRLIAKINGISLIVYSNDHNPPHFHVRCERFSARYTIDPIEQYGVQNGTVRSKDHKKIIKWAENNQETLKVIWQNTRTTTEANVRIT